MRVLIAYRSKYGTTAACARALGQRIHAEAAFADLARQPWPSAREFDVVVVGGSIYGGRIQREVRVFCERQREVLLSRKVGLYICCMYEGEQAQAELQGAYPEWLSAHAFAAGLFGGELHHARLTLLDRFLLLGLRARLPGSSAHRPRGDRFNGRCRQRVAAGCLSHGSTPHGHEDHEGRGRQEQKGSSASAGVPGSLVRA